MTDEEKPYFRIDDNKRHEDDADLIKFRKKLRGGLKRCPLHFIGSGSKKYPKSTEFLKRFDGWYECSVCHGFMKVPDEISESAISVGRSLVGNHVVFRTSCFDYILLNFKD